MSASDGQRRTVADQDAQLYEVPGHGPVGPEAIERYASSKRRFRLPSAAIKEHSSEHAPNERPERSPAHPASVANLLRSPEERDQLDALNLIEVTPIWDRLRTRGMPLETCVKLLRIALQSAFPEVRRAAARIAQDEVYAAQAGLAFAVSDMVEEGLRSPDTETQRQAARSVEYLQRPDQMAFIEFGLNSGTPEIQRICAEQSPRIGYKELPYFQEQISQIAEEGLNDHTAGQQALAEYARMIRHAALKDRARLISEGFAIDDATVHKICIETIDKAPLEEKDLLGEKASRIVEEGLGATSRETRLVYADAIKHLPYEFVSNAIVKGLSSDDPEVQLACARYMGKILIEEERIPAILAGLATNDPRIQRHCMKAVKSIKNLFTTYPEFAARLQEEYGNLLVEPGLYLQSDVRHEGSFSRSPFRKSGSETTLLGGKLRGKAIIRHIDSQSFAAWQSLYENHSLWKAHGYAYVPIEPILSFRANGKGLVDVISGVVDLNLSEWISLGGAFAQELQEDRRQILRIIAEAGVDHGHSHERNFCLRFYRHADGAVDFERKPRLYLIDFDKARS